MPRRCLLATGDLRHRASIRAGVLFAATLAMFAGPTHAEPRTVAQALPAGAQALAGEGSAFRVRIIYLEAGDDLLSRFGHSAIWIENQRDGTHRAYNFGLSNTVAPDFYRQLASGAVMSRIDVRDPYEMMQAYAEKDRSVWIQELVLTPGEQQILVGHLEFLARPDAPPYRQDFYHDNCTTGIRDALDLALGGRLREVTSAWPASGTFRTHSLRYAAAYPILHAGLSVGLARGVDEPLTAWEEMFLPEMLRKHLAGVQLVSESGAASPLVLGEEAWFQSDRDDVPRATVLAWPWYAAAGGVMAVVLATLGVLARNSLIGQLGLLVLAGGWLVTTGLLGLVLLLLWTVTGQTLAHGNLNVLHLNPVGLVVGWVMLTGGLGSERERRVVRGAVWVLAALALVGIILKLIPGVEQANGTVIAATFPVVVGMGFGLWWWDSAAVRDVARSGASSAHVSTSSTGAMQHRLASGFVRLKSPR